MANMCENTVYFFGETTDITKLYDLIEGENSSCEILRRAGFKTDVDNNIHDIEDHKLSYSGEILYQSDIEGFPDGSSFVVVTDSRWSPEVNIWDLIIKHYGWKIKFSVSSVEPGNEVFSIYDPDNLGYFDPSVCWVDISEGVAKDIRDAGIAEHSFGDGPELCEEEEVRKVLYALVNGISADSEYSPADEEISTMAASVENYYIDNGVDEFVVIRNFVVDNRLSSYR